VRDGSAGNLERRIKTKLDQGARKGLFGREDQTVRFHILDEHSRTRVKQHMINSDSGDEVANEEIQKGFEVEPGTFVILDEKELESLDQSISRD